MICRSSVHSISVPGEAPWVQQYHSMPTYRDKAEVVLHSSMENDGHNDNENTNIKKRFGSPSSGN